jgi:serine/threonine protein kinase
MSKLLLEDRPKRDKMRRHVSLHVGSRWYRAPEISIIEKQYDQASDLWGIGCILYELLLYTQSQDQPQKYIKSDFQNKRFLF